MTKKKRKLDFRKVRNTLPYVVTGVVTLAIVSLGSLSKQSNEVSLSMDAIAQSGYKVSVDQLSESYVVADLSDAFQLASASDVASNYVTIKTMYDDVGLATTGKFEKPNLTNVTVSRGVVEYTVQNGETMESIAKKYGVTTDQIRWSNGLKTTEINAGDLLYIPSVAGIVYTVQSGDTVDALVSRYGGTAAEIVALNDLEVDGLSEGTRIVIKGGTLPETERPEYVPPVVYAPTYTYLGSTSSRQNVTVVSSYFYDAGYPYPNPNPGVPGWCTWYAWYWRATSPLSLGELGHEGRNANTWSYNYAYRGVGSTPVVGAVFQTAYGGGGYGHVGVVVGINGDGSIVVREMNYAGRYVVTEATIPAAYVGNFNYIY